MNKKRFTFNPRYLCLLFPRLNVCRWITNSRKNSVSKQIRRLKSSTNPYFLLWSYKVSKSLPFAKKELLHGVHSWFEVWQSVSVIFNFDTLTWRIWSSSGTLYKSSLLTLLRRFSLDWIDWMYWNRFSTFCVISMVVIFFSEKANWPYVVEFGHRIVSNQIEGFESFASAQLIFFPFQCLKRRMIFYSNLEALKQI